jgi:hypothetical protein
MRRHRRPRDNDSAAATTTTTANPTTSTSTTTTAAAADGCHDRGNGRGAGGRVDRGRVATTNDKVNGADDELLLATETAPRSTSATADFSRGAQVQRRRHRYDAAPVLAGKLRQQRLRRTLLHTATPPRAGIKRSPVAKGRVHHCADGPTRVWLVFTRLRVRSDIWWMPIVTGSSATCCSAIVSSARDTSREKSW